MTRNSTSCGRVGAAPHSSEAMVKPITEETRMRRKPKRTAQKPASGVAIAADTIYEVITQATCSWVEDSEPWMLGSATLAMVPSSACMIVAIMTTTVSQRRRRSASASIVRPSQPDHLQQIAERAPVAGVDLDGRAHAHAKRRIAFLADDRGADGNPLYDLDPVARCVLRRQHGELRAGRLGKIGRAHV